MLFAKKWYVGDVSDCTKMWNGRMPAICAQAAIGKRPCFASSLAGGASKRFYREQSLPFMEPMQSTGSAPCCRAQIDGRRPLKKKVVQSDTSPVYHFSQICPFLVHLDTSPLYHFWIHGILIGDIFIATSDDHGKKYGLVRRLSWVQLNQMQRRFCRFLFF